MASDESKPSYFIVNSYLMSSFMISVGLLLFCECSEADIAPTPQTLCDMFSINTELANQIEDKIPPSVYGFARRMIESIVEPVPDVL